MLPNKQRVHIDAPLTQMSVAYMQDEAHFIGNKVFPIIPVDKASDYYYVFPKEAWFSDDAKPRGVGTEAESGGYEVSSDKYGCVDYAFRHPIYDQVRANADSQVRVDNNGVKLCTRKGLIRIERLWTSNFFKPGVWGTDVNGVAAAPGNGEVIKWSDYGTSKPVANVDRGKETILRLTGFEPNTMVVGFGLFNTLKEHPIMLDKIKYTQKGIVTEDLMAEVFGVERFFVAKSVTNVAKKGAAANMQFNFGNGAWLGYVNPDPSPEMPSAGYTFAWKGASEGMGEQVGIRRYREEAKRADWVEMEMSVDLKKVSAELGYFWNDIID